MSKFFDGLLGGNKDRERETAADLAKKELRKQQIQAGMGDASFRAQTQGQPIEKKVGVVPYRDKEIDSKEIGGDHDEVLSLDHGNPKKVLPPHEPREITFEPEKLEKPPAEVVDIQTTGNHPTKKPGSEQSAA